MPQTLSGDTGVSKADTNSVDTAAIQAGAVTPAKLSQPLTLGSRLLTTSGTSANFTGIPSWAKRITLMLAGVSINGAGSMFIRLGTSAGFEATGYTGSGAYFGGTNETIGSLLSTGFGGTNGLNGNSAGSLVSGSISFTLLDPATNTWAASGLAGRSDAGYVQGFAGHKALAGVLDRIQIATSNGTDLFDAGMANIMYEG